MNTEGLIESRGSDGPRGIVQRDLTIEELARVAGPGKIGQEGFTWKILEKRLGWMASRKACPEMYVRMSRKACPERHVKEGMSRNACPERLLQKSMSVEACPENHIQKVMFTNVCSEKYVQKGMPTNV